jgi:hypothetical protein
VSTVEEIKSAIEKLSLEERAELARWFHDWSDDEWDRQMAADLEAGKLDGLLKQVREDIDAGRLDEGP